MFDTENSFWVNQVSNPTLKDSARYNGWLGYENWDCTFSPDDFFLPACLKHDVSWDSLRKFVGGVEDDTIDAAWNSRNKHAADAEFTASLLEQMENRAVPIGCLASSTLLETWGSSPEAAALEIAGCMVWRTELATLERIKVMRFAVSVINSKGVKPTEQDKIDVANNPRFVERP